MPKLAISGRSGARKLREVLIYTISVYVFEPPFDAKPLYVPPHFGEVSSLMVEIMDLRRTVPFYNDHGVGIGRTQMKLKKIDPVLLEGRRNERSRQGHELVSFARPHPQPSNNELHWCIHL